MDINLDIAEFDEFIENIEKGSTPGSSGLSYKFMHNVGHFLEMQFLIYVTNSVYFSCIT